METIQADGLASKIYQDMKATFQQHPQYNDDLIKTLAAHVAGTVAASMAAIPHQTIKSPNKEQQDCYAACAETKAQTLKEAAGLGFPFGIPIAVGAIFAFNACRHTCDHAKVETASKLS